MNNEHLYAEDALEMANFSAQENLLYIRQKLSDELWEADMRRRTEMGSKKVTKVEIKSLVEEHIEYMMLTLGLEIDWQPGQNKPLPFHPASRKAFGELINVSEDRVEKLEKDNPPKFTLSEAIAISAIGNMDIGTFLTPSLNSLRREFVGNLNMEKGAQKVKMYQWVMWLRGLRPLPGQNYKKYLENSSTPSISLKKVIPRRIQSNPEIIQLENKTVNNSPFAIRKIINEEKVPLSAAVSNPFSTVLNQRIFSDKEHEYLIRATLGISTLIKKLHRTKFGSANKKAIRDNYSINKTNFTNLVSRTVVVLMELGD